jgi:hypothetical protein
MAETSITTTVSKNMNIISVDMSTFNSGFLIFRDTAAVSAELLSVQIEFYYNAGNSEYIPIDIGTPVFDPHKNDSMSIPVSGLTSSLGIRIVTYLTDDAVATSYPVSISILPSKIN